MCLYTSEISLQESFANTLTFPSKSDTSLAYRQLIQEFPAGKLSPQYATWMVWLVWQLSMVFIYPRAPNTF